MTFGSFRMDTRQKLTVREILSEVSTVRPEPFGSELKAELLTAVGSCRCQLSRECSGSYRCGYATLGSSAAGKSVSCDPSVRPQGGLILKSSA